MSHYFTYIDKNFKTTFLFALCFYLLKVKHFIMTRCVKYKVWGKWKHLSYDTTYKVLLYPLGKVSLILSENTYIFQVLFVLPNFQGAKQCLLKAYRLKTARCDEVEKKLRIGKIKFLFTMRNNLKNQ